MAAGIARFGPSGNSGGFLTMDIIGAALAEDLGNGDLTTRYFTNPHQFATARLIARQPCVLAGARVAEEIFLRVDPHLSVTLLHHDGDQLSKGGLALEVRGAAISLLSAERVALNFVQRLSGIATLTRQYVDAIRGTGARLLDTRKTTPGLRSLEKSAVLAGGASNHRMGLFDMIMVKDNHLAAHASLDDIQRSIDHAKAEHPSIQIEIEADTLEQALLFYTLHGVDRILLDNMSLSDMEEAVAARPQNLKLEASGGITLQSVRAVAETGVDFISVGALTHSAPAVDLSLELENS